MTAIDDVEMTEKVTAGTRAVKLRNKTRDRTIAAVVRVGGACEPSIVLVTVKPLAEAEVCKEGPLDRTCAYEIQSAAYLV